MSLFRFKVARPFHRFASVLSRRELGALSASLLAGTVTDAGAKSNKGKQRHRNKHKRRTKVQLCNKGQTIEVKKKQQNSYMADGATKGACTCLEATEGLQAAIDTTPPGGTLELCPGRWLLQRSIVIARDITLSGAGAEQTILDGGDATRVVRVDLGAVTLRGLTITGGKAGDVVQHDGGGIFNLGELTVVDCSVRGNSADNRGGGIYNGFGNISITNSLITENTAELGGGIYQPTHSLSLSNSRIERNVAIHGAGIYNGGTTVWPTPGEGQSELRAGSVIQGNVAHGQGGGVFINSGKVTLRHSSILQNDALDGGGAYITLNGTLDLAENSNVANNVVNNCAGAKIPDTCSG